MSRVIEHKELTDTLAITECKDGFWLYDKTRGMNLSMRAKTSEQAFVEALTYYQKRLLNAEKSYSDLKSKVDTFIVSFAEDDEDRF